MHLKIVLLFAAFALVRANEACGDEKAGLCILKILSNHLEDTTEEQDCAALAEASSCLSDVTEDCIGEARNEEIEEKRQFLRVLAATNCPRKDLPEEAEECVNDLELELMACIDDGVAEVLEHLMDLPEGTEVDENDVKCGMYESITKCIVMKVEDKCGEEASLAALVEMMDEDEIKESCKPAVSQYNLKGFMLDLRKKKRK